MDPKKYDFIEINNFIVAQASAEHFEADRAAPGGPLRM